VLGAVAAAIWLRRRQAERPALPPGPPVPEPGPAAAVEDPAARRPTRRPTRRFERAAQRVDRPAGRFARTPEPRSIDIVTVVDDLLGAPR
jgi:hypothetical protein